MKITAKLPTLILGIMLAFSASAGTESGGGGGAVLENGRTILLDFYNLNPLEFSLTLQKSSAKNVARTTEQPGPMNPQTIAAVQAKKIIGEWAALPMDTISFIVSTSFGKKVSWTFIQGELTPHEFYLPVYLPAQPTVLPAAYYTTVEGVSYGVELKTNVWNDMNRFNQTALLIHEALRHVQFSALGGFDEETLQKATVVYVACKPNMRLNFFLSYVLNHGAHLASQIYGDFGNMLTESCKERP